MGVRIRRAGAVEVGRGVAAQTIIARIEAGVLPGQYERRLEVECGEAVGHRRKLDRFGPRADNQPNICTVQISP
jgi:hypothetical protein